MHWSVAYPAWYACGVAVLGTVMHRKRNQIGVVADGSIFDGRGVNGCVAYKANISKRGKVC